MEILIAVGAFAVAVVLLSLGTVLFRKPLKGSCGGISAAMGEDGDGNCGACGRPVSDCPERKKKSART